MSIQLSSKQHSVVFLQEVNDGKSTAAPLGIEGCREADMVILLGEGPELPKVLKNRYGGFAPIVEKTMNTSTISAPSIAVPTVIAPDSSCVKRIEFVPESERTDDQGQKVPSIKVTFPKPKNHETPQTYEYWPTSAEDYLNIVSAASNGATFNQRLKQGGKDYKNITETFNMEHPELIRALIAEAEADEQNEAWLK